MTMHPRAAALAICALLAIAGPTAAAVAADPEAPDCSQATAERIMTMVPPEAATPGAMPPADARTVDDMYSGDMRMMRAHILAIARLESACGTDLRLKADARSKVDLLESVREDRSRVAD